MKTILKYFITIPVIFCLACNSTNTVNDSVDSANKKNQSLDNGKFSSGNIDSTAADENFMVKAYSGGMLEVMLGRIAINKASSAQVKQFGQMMITDHTTADSEIAVMAKLKDIAIPYAPSNEQFEHINRLNAEHGNDFDKDYVSLMIDDR